MNFLSIDHNLKLRHTLVSKRLKFLLCKPIKHSQNINEEQGRIKTREEKHLRKHGQREPG